MGHEKNGSSSDDKQSAVNTTNQTADIEKQDEKAKERTLRAVAATAPGAVQTPLSPAPSTGTRRSTGGSSQRTSRSLTDQLLSPTRSMMKNGPPRVPTRTLDEFSDDNDGDDLSEDEETAPGAVRVSYSIPPSPATYAQSMHTNTTSDDDDDDDEVMSLGAEFTCPPLTAEAVPADDEAERIRELREHNEALQRQMQEALENERKARAEVKQIAAAPSADVTVVSGDVEDSENFSMARTASYTPQKVQPAIEVTKADDTSRRKTYLIMMVCVVLFLAGIAAGTLLGMKDEKVIMMSEDSSEAIRMRTDYLKVVLQEHEPLNEQAFHYLTEFDEWKPESTPEDYLEEDEGSPEKTARERQWLERYALAVLYYSTNGDTAWETTFGWLSPINSHCSTRMNKWLGVWCSEDSVIYMELGNNAMDGTIPTEINLLSNLGYLNLEDQMITGSIPELPASLTSLKLGNNQLTGSIPVLPELDECDLSANSFVNTLNGEIRGCSL
ncbi:unnamed protein product [Cylindrotheca closterium]|uniref:Uncharacterized protein n=1 Tax=Cylindrotheca closterium TaxID=2856 RepID=A0AAD2FNS9_9STRA|nr:unnamed protein product [Cylindrotheca closterium]